MVDAVQFHHNPIASTKVPQLTALGLDMERTAGFHDKVQEELEHAMEILKLLD